MFPSIALAGNNLAGQPNKVILQYGGESRSSRLILDVLNQRAIDFCEYRLRWQPYLKVSYTMST